MIEISGPTATIKAEELATLSDLYISYLGLILNTFTFVIGISGAMLAYVLKESKSRFVVYSLFIPSFICLTMGIGFILSVPKARVLGEALKELQVTLNLSLVAHSEILIYTLTGFGIFLIITGCILAALPIFKNHLNSLEFN